MEVQSDSVSSETSTADVTIQATAEPAAAETQASPQPEGSQTPAAADSVYTPNYKFKASNQELEMDEWLRPAIKSAEQEKKVRELYEKAYGLDEAKSVRENIRNEYKTYKNQTEPVMRWVKDGHQNYHGGLQALEQGNVNGFVHKMDQAFKAFGVDSGLLKKYIFHKLQFEELPQDRKQEYNRYNEAEIRNQQMQEQLQAQTQYFQQFAVQAKTAELNQAISKPEIAPIIQAFNQRNGEQSFQNEVIRLGQYYSRPEVGGKDMPADVLVNEIIQRFNLTAPVQAPPQAATQAGQAHQVPTIPIVKGSNGSPAGKVIKSMDDVRKLAQEKYG